MRNDRSSWLPALRVRLAAFAAVAALALACAPVMRSTIAGAPSPQLMAQFWNEPRDVENRDLVYGVGGPRDAPSPDVTYTVVKDINHGFSPKIEVRDPSGMKWKVKMGQEAQPEVVSSRIVWAVGYHQPPDYYLPTWSVDDHGKRLTFGPARLRPRARWIRKEGDWSWHSNPFVDTQPFRGLVVLMMILNSTDLKDDNNALYDLAEPIDHAERWYVVKDLGATLGETAPREMRRGEPDLFEREGFITATRGDRVFFAFKGRHQELLSVVHPADVRWMCTLLDRLTDRQWHDAFRAGGYNDDATGKYLRKIHEKIAQGKSLQGGV